MKPLAVQDNEPLDAAIHVGQSAPDFIAHDLNGMPVNLKTILGGNKALLIFYRAGWCPYCDQQLATISRDHKRFEQLGTTIVAVSSEGVENGKELLKKLNLPFTLLSDTRFEGIDKYGVRDANPSESTRKRGITQLSKPAAFIIDGAGIVRFRYVGKTASDRPANEDLLRILGEADDNDDEPAKEVRTIVEEEEGNDACELRGGDN